MEHDGAGPAGDAIDMVCEHCGWSPWAGRSYEEELADKGGILREAFADAGIETAPQAVVASPRRQGYRNTVKLVFGFDKAAARARLGIYRPGSHRLVGLESCREHHPAFEPLIFRVAELVREFGLPVYSEERRKGFLRYLLLKALPPEDRLLACFVTPHDEGAWQEKLLAMAERLRAEFPALKSVTQNINPTTGNAVLGSVTNVLSGQFSVPCTFLETPVPVTGTSFLQANLGLFRVILEDLRAGLADVSARRGTPPRVADLYCGVGAIGLSITTTEALFLLEGEHASQLPMVEGAREDGREHIEAVRGRVEDSLVSLEVFEPDLVIVDPPRKGLAPELVEELRRQSPEDIFYLSCNPATLARDVAALLDGGRFRLESLRGYDMLPGTSHLEALAVLRRA